MTELQKLERKMDKRFDELTALLSDFATDVYRRFEAIELRLDRFGGSAPESPGLG